MEHRDDVSIFEISENVFTCSTVLCTPGIVAVRGTLYAMPSMVYRGAEQ